MMEWSSIMGLIMLGIVIIGLVKDFVTGCKK
jgi:hypothetical protein